MEKDSACSGHQMGKGRRTKRRWERGKKSEEEKERIEIGGGEREEVKREENKESI